MSQADETKVVQTELSATLYDRFKSAADERGLTIKEAATEAITAFTAHPGFARSSHLEVLISGRGSKQHSTSTRWT